ncbi:MAG: protein translocase subunit SecF [Pseudoxanthomonas suwonensis]|nr:protein translocase subunit SecF [Pseudoxanthomonas suwonensis]
MNIFPLSFLPANPRIDFMRMRWISMTVAVLLLVVAIGAIAFKGFNLALDFTGGTAVTLRFEQPVDVQQVRERIDASGVRNAQVQGFGNGTDVLVRIRAEEGDEQRTVGEANEQVQQIRAAASTADNPATLQRSESIGSQVSGELTTKAAQAVLFVLIGFLIYISLRFEWKFAVVASLTTFFDVAVVAGFFALTGREFDLAVLAGLLGVMGFSINDTIVIFDRVRENFRGMRASPREILNVSINQTLSRTIITSVVFFLSVLALYIYGGDSLEGLALTQMLGAIFGTLSSIFVACVMLTMGPLTVTKQDLMPKARDEAELARRP